MDQNSTIFKDTSLFLKLTASNVSLFCLTDNCNGPLVSTLLHSSFQSSSQSSVSYAAYNAKLNRRDGEYKRACSCTHSVFLHALHTHHPPAVPAVTSEPKLQSEKTIKHLYGSFCVAVTWLVFEVDDKWANRFQNTSTFSLFWRDAKNDGCV